MSTIGYARVSTGDQDENTQVARLRAAGAEEVYVDHASGKNQERPEWAACRARLKEGDILLVVRIDRLGRSLLDLISIIEDLGEGGVQFQSLAEAIDTTGPGGRLFFHITAAFAEYERALIRARTTEALAQARARGVKLGRRPSLDAEKQAVVRRAHESGESISALARTFGVSRRTIYRALEG